MFIFAKNKHVHKMDTDKKYYAFISYKREDEKQAEWLRHKLVHYRLPLRLRKENPEIPKVIRLYFVMRLNLPVVSLPMRYLQHWIIQDI